MSYYEEKQRTIEKFDNVVDSMIEKNWAFGIDGLIQERFVNVSRKWIMERIRHHVNEGNIFLDGKIIYPDEKKVKKAKERREEERLERERILNEIDLKFQKLKEDD